MAQDRLQIWLDQVAELVDSKEKLEDKMQTVTDHSNAGIASLTFGDRDNAQAHLSIARRGLKQVHSAIQAHIQEHEDANGQDTWPGQLPNEMEI